MIIVYTCEKKNQETASQQRRLCNDSIMIPGASHHPPPCRQRNIVSKMWLACGGIVLIVRFACGSIVLMVCLVDGVFVLIAWLLGWGIVSIVWWMEWCTKKGQGNRRKNLSKTVQTKTNKTKSFNILVDCTGWRWCCWCSSYFRQTLAIMSLFLCGYDILFRKCGWRVEALFW